MHLAELLQPGPGYKSPPEMQFESYRSHLIPPMLGALSLIIIIRGEESKPLFGLGQIVGTPGAVDALKKPSRIRPNYYSGILRGIGVTWIMKIRKRMSYLSRRVSGNFLLIN
jgi:hypothetical protein